MNQNAIQHAMRQAMLEGRKAIAVCADNPPVGCVLMRDGQHVASGHTNAPGLPHAEAMALQALGGDARHCVVFVTLEPCSFHGRTPSCALALIAAGVQEVHIGMLDPDPRNNGRGVAMLRDAGITVHVGVLEDEVRAQLEGFVGRAL